MKKIGKDRIVNIEETQRFDGKFLFECMSLGEAKGVEVVYLSDLLEEKKNEDILQMVEQKPAMYSNVYSPKDELQIFQELFDDALENKKRIHIVGITLKEEVEILEKYYTELGFLREDINCFAPDFSVPLVTASVKIENLMWKGSDYKAQKSAIFFNPPIRESGQVKAMFKGINRGVTAGIYIENYTPEVQVFLGECVRNESILPITLAKVLKYNCEELGFKGESFDMVVECG